MYVNQNIGDLSNHRGDFYCLDCFNSYTTKNKFKGHEEIRNNHSSCRIEMPEWANKILKHNPGDKSLKMPFTIYFDVECILKNYNLFKRIHKHFTQTKRLEMNLLVGQCL